MDKEYIKAKLSQLPHQPGSYQMKDRHGEIIYVGKAKDLHNRVNQYFVGAHDFKTTKMVSHIEDFDFIVTKTEKEALVLEINLIKKYRPKYNIQFIDDSSYPYIKLTQETHPRLMIVRDPKKDKKAKYFGPFPDTGAARDTLRVLQSLYPFRRCNHLPDKLCLYYHLHQCLGPCVYEVSQGTYAQMKDKIIQFFNGNTKEVEQSLKDKMMQASENLEFEKAQEYKNLYHSIQTVVKDEQNIETGVKGTLDAFAYYVDKGYIAITGFLVRHGVVLNKEFRLRPLYDDPKDTFIQFLMQYYADAPLPKEVILPVDLEIESLQEVLDTLLVQPKRGYKVRLLEMCLDNAKKQLDLKFQSIARQDSQTQKAMEQFNQLIDQPISRIELFDNSHTSGTFTVAGCVVYIDGEPSRKDYRLYKLHTGNSDIDSMKEVIYRRYFRLLNEEGILPDCLIVDGGQIQIQAAKEILHALDLQDRIVLLGLVKDDHHATRALMNQDFTTFEIDKNSPLFFLLTRMQDEVHRVAITYHRKLRLKAQTKSILDEIEGVGPKRKKLLLRHFGSLSKLKAASVDEIGQVVPAAVALAVYKTLHQSE